MGVKPQVEERKQPVGLALLLQPTVQATTALPPTSVQPLGLAAAVSHVFNLSPSDASVITTSGDVYTNVSRIIENGGTTTKSVSSSSISDNQTPGRLGPKLVEVDQRSVSGQVSYDSSGLAVESMSNFSSFRANTCVFAGKWMYEVTLNTAGIQQIGWCTVTCPFTHEEGVGDAPDSYAFDGKRTKKWNVKPQTYGQEWAPGDVIGSCIDLDIGELSFYRNGKPLGVAYNTIQTMEPTLAYFPAVSLSYAEKCEFNFGARPFEYPVPGYKAVQMPPPSVDTSQVQWLCECFGRLLLSTQPPVPSCLTLPDLPQLPQPTTVQPASVCDLHADASSSVSFPLAWHDASLVAGLILQHLTPLLAANSYFVWNDFVPLLLGLHSRVPPHNPKAVADVLHWLNACSSRQLHTAILGTVFEVLSKKCITALMEPTRDTYTASYPYLALMNAILKDCAAKKVWLQHGKLDLFLESSLSRKAPTHADLKAIIPEILFPGSIPDPQLKKRHIDSMQALESAIRHVEEQQCALLCSCLGEPASGDPEQDCLLEFLAYVLQKNRAAHRDVPPPGLSDPTVLASIYFALLRLLRPMFHQSVDFPAGELFVKTHAQGELEPVNDMQRVGGVMSHIMRAHPVSPPDLLPLHLRVSQPPPSRRAGIAQLKASQVPELLQTVMTLYWLRIERLAKSQATLTQAVSTRFSALQALLRDNPGAAESGSASSLPSDNPGPSSSSSSTPPTATHTDGSDATASGSSLLPLGALPPQAGPTTLSQNLANSSVADRVRQAIQEMSASLGASFGGRFASDTANMYREEIVRDVRDLSLFRLAFFGGWKVEAHLELAAFLSRLLLQVCAHGNLLRTVPTTYLDCITDILQVFVRNEGKAAKAEELLGGGFQDIISLLCTVLNDERIANPDCKEQLVHVVSLLMEDQGFLRAFESNPTAQERLVPAIMASFDSRLWHPVSTMLLKVVGGHGFGQASTQKAGSPTFRTTFITHMKPNVPEFKAFLNKLFNMLNWTVTEFTVAVKELHEHRGSSRRQAADPAQQSRRAGVMFDICCGLLRLLELTATHGPHVFLDAEQSINLDKLLESLAFVLTHFTTGADATRLSELLAQEGASSTDRTHLLPAKVKKADLLAPLLGVLLGLWQAEQQSRTQPVAGHVSFVDRYIQGSDARTSEQMRHLLELDWAAAFPAADTASSVQVFRAMCIKLHERKKEMEETMLHIDSAQDVPDDFLDPITFTFMTDPVMLPDSQVVVDRSTIQRHLTVQQTDPFSRQPLTLAAVKPADELRVRIQQWQESKRRPG